MDLDLIRLSRYPFLKVSRDHVKGLGISLGAMLTGENVTVREAAVRRIEEAVEGSPIDLKRKRARDEVERDLLSYPIARFLVAAVADPHLIKWFSHHEGERARAFLEGEDTDIVRYVGEELGLPLMPPPEGDDSGERIPRISKVDMMRGREAGRKDLWWVSLTDFLPSRRNITGPQWDLSNRRVKKGMVALERSSYIRLLQERVRTRVEEGLWSRPSVPAHPGVKELINGLRGGSAHTAIAYGISAAEAAERLAEYEKKQLAAAHLAAKEAYAAVTRQQVREGHAAMHATNARNAEGGS